MISAVRIDWLDEGALPLYDRDDDVPEIHVWNLEINEHSITNSLWEARAIRSRRILLPLNLDITYEALVPVLGRLLRPVHEFEERGVLVFPLRCCHEIEGVGRLIVAGLSFVPGEAMGVEGIPLDGAEPEDLILQFCRGVTRENTDQLHPAIRDPLMRDIARREERDRALARSKRLLEDCLTPEQRHELATTDAFHVRARDGQLFKIARKFSHNVWLIEDGEPVIEYCIVASDFVPLFDSMLAQKLLLEAAPEDFFRIANFRRLDQRRRSG